MKLITRFLLFILLASMIGIAFGSCQSWRAKVEMKKHQRNVKKIYKIAAKDELAISKVCVALNGAADSFRVITEYIKGKPDTIMVDTGSIITLDCDSIIAAGAKPKVEVKCPPAQIIRIVDTIKTDSLVIRPNRHKEKVLEAKLEEEIKAHDFLKIDYQVMENIHKKNKRIIWLLLSLLGGGLILLLLKIKLSKKISIFGNKKN